MFKWALAHVWSDLLHTLPHSLSNCQPVRHFTPLPPQETRKHFWLLGCGLSEINDCLGHLLILFWPLIASPVKLTKNSTRALKKTIQIHQSSAIDYLKCLPTILQGSLVPASENPTSSWSVWGNKTKSILRPPSSIWHRKQDPECAVLYELGGNHFMKFWGATPVPDVKTVVH